MALSGYNRIIFVDNSDTIYNNAASSSALINYISSSGFDGMYLFNTDNYFTDYGEHANINSFITGAISGGINIVGAIVGNSTNYNPYYVDYCNTYFNLHRIHLYNDFWNSGNTFPSWSVYYSEIADTTFSNNLLALYPSFTQVQPSTWIHYIQNSASTDIKTSGYTEIEASKQIINIPIASGNSFLVNGESIIFLSAFDTGIPLYTTVNDKKITNQINRLDLLAKASQELGVTSSLYLYIHAGQTAFGSSGNYSGFSLRYAGDFDTFENQIIDSVVERMTPFQRQYLNLKGFAYYDYSYCVAALSGSGNPTPPATSSLYRIIKIDKTENRLTSSQATQEMLDLISNNNYNWIQLYGLNTIMASNTLTASMATFISKSRTLGVERVGAIRSIGQNRWNDVLDYNVAHPWYEQFDDFNIENEFWFWPSSSANPANPPSPSQFPDSRPFTLWEASGSWLKSTLDGAPYYRGNAYTASGGKPWIISAYVQNYNAGSDYAWINPYSTASVINDIVDVYEATNYNSGAPSPAKLTIATGPFPQLDYIASAAFDAGVTRSFVPIFSLEETAYGADNDFSGDYFSINGLNVGENTWTSSYNGLSFTHKTNLNLIGFNYFDYEWVSASVGV